MKLHHWEPATETICRLTRALHDLNAEHVFIGECALRAYGCRNLTDSVEVCADATEVPRLRDNLRNAGFEPAERKGLRPTGSDTHAYCMLHSSGTPVRPHPHLREVRYPHPAEAESIDGLAVPPLARVVEICLATRRYRDWAYVVEAIRKRGLERDFAEQLHLAVRSAYLQCYDQKLEEDRYNPEIHDRHPDEPQG